MLRESVASNIFLHSAKVNERMLIMREQLNCRYNTCNRLRLRELLSRKPRLMGVCWSHVYCLFVRIKYDTCNRLRLTELLSREPRSVTYITLVSQYCPFLMYPKPMRTRVRKLRSMKGCLHSYVTTSILRVSWWAVTVERWVLAGDLSCTRSGKKEMIHANKRGLLTQTFNCLCDRLEFLCILLTFSIWSCFFSGCELLLNASANCDTDTGLGWYSAPTYALALNEISNIIQCSFSCLLWAVHLANLGHLEVLSLWMQNIDNCF